MLDHWTSWKWIESDYKLSSTSESTVETKSVLSSVRERWTFELGLSGENLGDNQYTLCLYFKCLLIDREQNMSNSLWRLVVINID